jgi:hypothetical protein
VAYPGVNIHVDNVSSLNNAGWGLTYFHSLKSIDIYLVNSFFFDGRYCWSGKDWLSHKYVVQSADARANLSSIEIIWYLGKNCSSVSTRHFIAFTTFRYILSDLKENFKKKSIV